MLEFKRSMDDYSLDVARGGELVAMVQWHPGRSPRVTLGSECLYLSIDELRQCVAVLERETVAATK